MIFPYLNGGKCWVFRLEADFTVHLSEISYARSQPAIMRGDRLSADFCEDVLPAVGLRIISPKKAQEILKANRSIQNPPISPPFFQKTSCIIHQGTPQIRAAYEA